MDFYVIEQTDALVKQDNQINALGEYLQAHLFIQHQPIILTESIA
jgi:hypothetical protein